MGGLDTAYEITEGAACVFGALLALLVLQIVTRRGAGCRWRLCLGRIGLALLSAGLFYAGVHPAIDLGIPPVLAIAGPIVLLLGWVVLTKPLA